MRSGILVHVQGAPEYAIGDQRVKSASEESIVVRAPKSNPFPLRKLTHSRRPRGNACDRRLADDHPPKVAQRLPMCPAPNGLRGTRP